jgi:predicted esterase
LRYDSGLVPGDLHHDQPIARRGPDPAVARLVVILVHGRGNAAEDMFPLADRFGFDDVAYVAPQASGRTWYPLSFLAPMPDNEPGISSGLHRLESIVAGLIELHVASNRIALLGFSQGGCLTLEFAARYPRRYAAVIGFSCGLIGPPGTPRAYTGSLEGTPMFLGCSDEDAHIPLERVHESADVFRRLSASVDERIYPGLGHTVSDDEVAAARTLLGSAQGPAA